MPSPQSPLKLILSFTLLFLANGYLGNSLNFEFELTARERLCFVEDIAEKTCYSIIMQLKDPLYKLVSFELMDPHKRAITKQFDRSHFQTMQTAKESGSYKMCITNNGNTTQRITFKFIQDAEVMMVEGVFNEVGRMPLWTDIISITMRTEHIKKMGELMIKLENEKFQAVDTVYETMSFFGYGFACITLLISFFQYKLLKSFFTKKKLI
jgi:hypothetical protein